MICTQISLTNCISESCSLNIYGNTNCLMVTLCSAECFPACFLLVDMGKHYVHSVKNKFLLYNCETYILKSHFELEENYIE
jgi:hypothetical protein